MSNEQILAKINETLSLYMEGLITDTEALTIIAGETSKGFIMTGFYHVSEDGVRALWHELRKGSVHVLYELTNDRMVDILMQKGDFTIKNYIKKWYGRAEHVKDYDNLHIEIHEEIAATVFALQHAAMEDVNAITFGKRIIQGLKTLK